MTISKKLGIWMDHSHAHLTEFTTEPIHTASIHSKFTQHDKEQSLNKSENLMHNKEQHEQAGYYKELAECIRNYNEVLLFGPTEAKSELVNIMKADARFAKIKIETKDADKMTNNQQHDFVRRHFSAH